MTELLEQLNAQKENTQEGKYLTFSLGTDVFGIEVQYVSEIVSVQPITKIPDSLNFEKGVINLRGKIIPVIDVRLMFSRDFLEYGNRTCIIIVNVFDKVMGLIVDIVQDIVSFKKEDIIPISESNLDSYNYFISAIGKEGNDLKLLLDCSKLVSYKN